MGSKQSGGEAPPATKEERELFKEQSEIATQQKELLQDQSSVLKILQPTLFQEIGLEPTFAGPDDSKTLAKQAEIKALEDELSLTPFERILKTRREGLPFKTNAFIQQEIEERNKELSKLQEDRITGFERKPDLRAQFREETEKQFLEQIRAGLAGGDPANPGLLKDLNRKQLETEERLRKRFGDRFRERSAGIEALERQEETKQILFDQSREQDIAQGESLFAQSRSTSQAIDDAIIARAIAVSQGQLPLQEGFGQASSALGQNLSQLSAIRAQQNAVLASAPQPQPLLGGSAGQLIGLGLGSLGTSNLGGLFSSGGNIQDFNNTTVSAF